MPKLITKVTVFPNQVELSNKKLGGNLKKKKKNGKRKTNRKVSQCKRFRFIIEHKINSKKINT